MPDGDASSGPAADTGSAEAPARRPALHWLAVVVAATLAGIVAVSVVSTRGEVGPGTVAVHGRWASDPDTTIAIPPLGEVVFETHRAPLAIEARIDEIDPVAAQELAADRDAVDRLQAETTDQLRALLVRWAWRALLVAAVAGAVAGALVWPRRLLPPLIGGGTALVAVTLLLGSTWLDFSRSALRDPEYRGALEEAPTVLAAIDRNWGGLEAVPGRLRALASNITELYAAVGTDTAPIGDGADEVRILHISDVHSNPIGLELARGLAEGFDVDAIVDTGDLTSFGLPVEARVATLLEDMPAPYFFVPGNHDTRANRDAIAAVADVTLLDGDVVDIGGIRLLGVADPAVTADGEDDDDSANAKRDAQAREVADDVARLDPDVLAVASVRQAADSLGQVPLVLAGNSHRRSDRTLDGTRVLTVGSTGATGLGSLTEAREGTYEAQILRFRDGRLAGIDYVTFSGVDGDYSVSRTVVPPPRSPASRPSGSTSTSTTTSATSSTTTSTAPPGASLSPVP